MFADGSFLAKIFEISNFKRRGAGIVVRVLEYTIDDGSTNDTEYRLITTMLDRKEISATEMANLLTTLGNRKRPRRTETHQRGPRMVLRSKSLTLSSKKSGATCAATTRSTRSCGKQRSTPEPTPTGCPS